MIVKYQKLGECLPRGYGVAYSRFDRDERVCYPIPLNVVVFLAREVYYWLAFMARYSVINKLLDRAERQGYEHGLADGLLECHRVFFCQSCKKNAMQRKGL